MKQPQYVLTRLVTITTLLATTPGCSFLFVKTPPDDGGSIVQQRARAGDCTSSKIAPGFDTAFGTLQVIRTGMAAAAPDSVYEDPNQPLSRGADIALGVGFAALFISSAVYGFSNTSRCSKLNADSDSEAATPEEPAEKWGPAAPAIAASPETPPVAEPSPTTEPATAEPVSPEGASSARRRPGCWSSSSRHPCSLPTASGWASSEARARRARPSARCR